MNGYIFKAMWDLVLEKKTLTPQTIDNKMKENGQQIPGPSVIYITNLTYGLPHFSIEEITDWAQIIKDKSVARNGIIKANELSAKLRSEEGNVYEVLAEHESGIFNLQTQYNTTGLVSTEDILDTVIVKARQAALSESTVTGLSTGLDDLDEKTLGLQQTDLIIIAARPSMGKTALSIILALNAAIENHAKVAVFSLEMSKEQLAVRMICRETRIDSQSFKTGALSEQQWDMVDDAKARISMTALRVDDTPGITTNYMRGKCRSYVSEDNRKLDLIVITIH